MNKTVNQLQSLSRKRYAPPSPRNQRDWKRRSTSNSQVSDRRRGFENPRRNSGYHAYNTGSASEYGFGDDRGDGRGRMKFNNGQDYRYKPTDYPSFSEHPTSSTKERYTTPKRSRSKKQTENNTLISLSNRYDALSKPGGEDSEYTGVSGIDE